MLNLDPTSPNNSNCKIHVCYSDFVIRSDPFQKVQRLLPTNIYVVLYNFKARHQDELDLVAGYKVTKSENVN